VGRPPATDIKPLSIGLPLRHRDELANLLQQLYDPASPNYRRYLTPAEFTRRFGPAQSDYDSVVAFARSNGWTVTSSDPGRVLVHARASVAAIEKACHINLLLYARPNGEPFFAPDREPALDLATPILAITGLNNYARPHPGSLGKGGARPGGSGAGSAPGGSLIGSDFRAAFAPGVSLDGSGQKVGLLEFDGYYLDDIQEYERIAGLPDLTPQNVYSDGYDGTPTENGVGEVSLDIEMALSMAPGMAELVLFEAGEDGFGNDMLQQMAADTTISQFSSSWFFQPDATTDQYLQQMAAQGQTFFECSGDNTAYAGGVTFLDNAGPPADSPYVISVGGTTLTTAGPDGAWDGETTWSGYNSGETTNGTGGGVSAAYAIPDWQTDTSMIACQGSPTQRNIPDVAMPADDIWVLSDNGQSNWFWGTSAAAPLWAGFNALVNQQAANFGLPPAGFINPALYRLGNSAQYNALFHDITVGNNTNFVSPNLYYATAGYDLCTGWGSPTGINLINALALSDPLVVSPAAGVSLGGAAGGPFYPTNAVFYLTNSGASSLHWSAFDPSSLWTLAPDTGTLPAGGNAAVTATLNASATALATGVYARMFVFSNITLHAAQVRPYTLQVGLPAVNFDEFYDTDWNEMPAGYGGVSWDNFYFIDALAFSGSTGYLTAMASAPNVLFNGNAARARIQSPAHFDLISVVCAGAWDDNLKLEAKGYIGSTLAFDTTNTLSATVPTTIHFNYFGVTEVDFTTSGGVKHSGFNGSGRYFAMDDVVLAPRSTPSASPTIQAPGLTGGAINLSWTTVIGQSYQLQASSNLVSSNWVSIGQPFTASNSVIATSDLPTNGARFYRLRLLP